MIYVRESPDKLSGDNLHVGIRNLTTLLHTRLNSYILRSGHFPTKSRYGIYYWQARKIISHHEIRTDLLQDFIIVQYDALQFLMISKIGEHDSTTL